MWFFTKHAFSSVDAKLRWRLTADKLIGALDL